MSTAVGPMGTHFNPEVPEVSPTLAANEQFGRSGQDIINMAFGESRFPPPKGVINSLRESADLTSYGPVPGGEELRVIVADYFTRRGHSSTGDHVIVGPGSKPLIFALLIVLQGDLLLTRPSWVSFEPQARMLGKSVHRIDAPVGFGGIPDPEGLVQGVSEARRMGRDPRILIVNAPDNPTGSIAPLEQVRQVAAIARDEDITIVSDEIYRDLSYDPDTYSSIASFCPERTYVTTGLSKSLGLGGWRVGALRAPADSTGRRAVNLLTSVASEIWSCVSSPIAKAAIHAFNDGDEVATSVRRSRLAHEAVNMAIFEMLRNAEVDCPQPRGAFYLYPDLTSRGASLRRRGVETGKGLADFLIRNARIATLPGECFGDVPDRLRVRMSTSLIGRWATEKFGPAEVNSVLAAAERQAVDELISPEIYERISQAFSSL